LEIRSYEHYGWQASSREKLRPGIYGIRRTPGRKVFLSSAVRVRHHNLTAAQLPLSLEFRAGHRRLQMAKLALVYGMRLFPAEELGEVREAVITLKNGRTSRVTMHLIEGSKEEIESTLQQSIEAFFEMYPEI